MLDLFFVVLALAGVAGVIANRRDAVAVVVIVCGFGILALVVAALASIEGMGGVS